MKIAIVGAGISGLSAAYYLTDAGHDVHVFESDDRIGGHTATKTVLSSVGELAVDTGFIVFNDWTYPNFIALLDKLKVTAKPTRMSFSVSCKSSGLEYAGSNWNTLFAQRKNLVNFRYLAMLKEIVRFNREAIQEAGGGDTDSSITLGEFLKTHNYSSYFAQKYLVPMGAAIWSSGSEAMLDFPLSFFVRFFKNHGLLSIKNRPQWYVIEGGSRSYLEPLTESFKDKIYTSARITDIRRSDTSVTLTTVSSVLSAGSEQVFDALVIATHSDQALSLLEDATDIERSILGAIPYKDNDVVLHTDRSLLPDNQRAWSAWNCRLDGSSERQSVCLTYNMNILQGLQTPETFCVSLNQTELIDKSRILGQYRYSHPVFTVEGEQAKQRWKEIAGAKRTWYCGAYWANGFHEDGVVSAKRVAESIVNNREISRDP